MRFIVELAGVNEGTAHPTVIFMLWNGSECKHINHPRERHVEFHWLCTRLEIIFITWNQSAQKKHSAAKADAPPGSAAPMRLSAPSALVVRASMHRGLIAQMSLRASCWAGIIQALVIWAESHQESSSPGWNAIETRLVHSLPAVCV